MVPLPSQLPVPTFEQPARSVSLEAEPTEPEPAPVVESAWTAESVAVVVIGTTISAAMGVLRAVSGLGRR